MLPNSNSTQPQSRLVRLLIVDDKHHVREELSRLLQITGEVEVVGEAADGEEAIRQAEALLPDVVLMDLEMPMLDGWEATRQIKVRQLAARVVALSIHSDSESVQRAQDSGVDAFVPKGIEFDHLLRTIIAQGKMDDDKEEDR